MKRGEIWLVRMSPSFGSEIRKTRPAVVVQTDHLIDKSTTVLVTPVTSKNTENIYPFDVYMDGGGLPKPSKALCEQTKCVDKRRLLKRMGIISISTTRRLNEALKTTLDLY